MAESGSQKNTTITSESQNAKKSVQPGLIKPGLLTNIKKTHSRHHVPNKHINSLPVISQKLPIKIGTTTKKPGLINIKITEQVIAKAPLKIPTISTKPLSTKPTTNSTTKPTKLIKLTKLKPGKRDEDDFFIKKDISEIAEERALQESLENLIDESEGPTENSYTLQNNLSNTPYRIRTEWNKKQEIYAPPDVTPVELTPIIIANHGYFICHQNQCLYSPETEEKIGIINDDRSILWYSKRNP